MISAVVLTKNEEKNIEECLGNLEWCNELIVVDDYSEDRTIEIAQNSKLKTQNYNSKLKIYKRRLNGNFADQRNFGLQKAQGEWIVFVDADERVSQDLAQEIGEATKNPGLTGYFIKRKDFLFGRWLKYGEAGNIKLLRLARKGSGEWLRPVHEFWNIEGNLGELKNPLLHYPHPTVAEFLSKINFYTDLDARIFFQNGGRVGFLQIIAYPIGKFILNYFLKFGFLDGMVGILFAAMMSFHSFLTRGKIWLLQWQKL